MLYNTDHRIKAVLLSTTMQFKYKYLIEQHIIAARKEGMEMIILGLSGGS